MQTEAQRVSQKVVELAAAKAKLKSILDTDSQLLTSPELVLDHPELKWEIPAAEVATPLLGTAQRLFASDRKLNDFR